MKRITLIFVASVVLCVVAFSAYRVGLVEEEKEIQATCEGNEPTVLFGTKYACFTKKQLQEFISQLTSRPS
jgi:hypothetical protein